MAVGPERESFPCEEDLDAPYSGGGAFVFCPDPTHQEHITRGGMMATKKNRAKQFREYQFQIDAYTPETFPMKRLSEYLQDLAVLFGETEHVHFDRLKAGTTRAVIRVE